MFFSRIILYINITNKKRIKPAGQKTGEWGNLHNERARGVCVLTKGSNCVKGDNNAF